MQNQAAKDLIGGTLSIIERLENTKLDPKSNWRPQSYSKEEIKDSTKAVAEKINIQHGMSEDYELTDLLKQTFRHSGQTASATI